MSRLRAGRHVGTVTDSQACELIFAWGGQCRSEAHHFTGCDGIGCWSKFDSDEDREAAWLAMRDELIYLPNPGSRPAAFWYYESAALCRHDPPCPRWPRDQSAWLQARRLPPAALADARELAVTYTTGDWPFDESMRHWLDRT